MIINHGSWRLDRGRIHFHAHSMAVAWRYQFLVTWAFPQSSTKHDHWLLSERAREVVESIRQYFCNLTLEVTSYHFCWILFNTRESVKSCPTFKGRRWQQSMKTRGVGVTGDHLRGCLPHYQPIYQQLIVNWFGY